MKVHFITYSDELYKDRQAMLDAKAKNEFDEVHSYNRKWLIETDFYKENNKILDEKRGGGYWLWKPFIILETFKKIDNGDAILYIDCGDIFSNNVREFLAHYFQDNSSLLTIGGHPQKDYTKRDCFIKMGCDESKYHNFIQLEAGIIGFKKTEEITNIIEEWLSYAKDENVITDIPNILSDNYPGFVDHRHDQSIITNLAVKHNLNVNKLLRNYIKCNVK